MLQNNPQKKHLRRSATNKRLRAFKSIFNCPNITFSSDVDQDKLVFGSHEILLINRCIISKYIQIKI